MEEPHRRIELQSLADLAYLERNIRAAAKQKLDLHLPPTAERDPLREKVAELVEAFVRETLAKARPNLSVNGMDLPAEGTGAPEGGLEEREEFEPYDTKLADRIRKLAQQRENLTKDVAMLRRTAPSEAAKEWEKAYLSMVEQEDKELERVKEEMLRTAAEESGKLGLEDALPRWEEVQTTWENAIGELVGLKGKLPETRARLERAEAVAEYLEGR